MANFTCDFCGKIYNINSSLKRHVRIHHQNSSSMKCSICDLKFSTRKDFLKHIHLIEHNENVKESSVNCNDCKITILKKYWPHHLRTNAHKDNCVKQFNKDVKCINSIFKNRIATYLFENENRNNLIPENFLRSIKDKIIEMLKDMLQKHTNIKFNIELFCKYMLVKVEDETCTIDIKSHQTKMSIINSTATTDDLSQLYSYHSDIIIQKMSEFQECDSGWTLTEISHMELNINEYKCIKGSHFISLPPTISKRKACINVQNQDEFCFKWAIISALNPVPENANRCSSYKIGDIKADIIVLENNFLLNFKNLNFPLCVNKIKEFELNNSSISINVFGLEDNNIAGPYYFTQQEKDNHINLLLLEEGEIFHYVLIKKISRLIKTQLTKHRRKVHVCNTCLIHFHNESALMKHKEECNKIVTKMPNLDNNILSFKNFKKQMDMPFVVYADFECILESMNVQNSNSVKSVQKHIPFAYSYYIKCTYDSGLDIFRIYSGEESAKHFIQQLVNDTLDIYNNHLSKVKPMNPLTPLQRKKQNEDKICHICSKFLSIKDRVADHCHLTGEYRGPAHNKCNLEYQIAHFIPIFFHNLSAYDCHLFVRELSSVKGDINIIPLNKELYVSISKKISVNEKDTFELRFLDSLRFMPSSLEKLANYLSDCDLITIKSIYQNDNEFNLMKRKGVFPYDYLDSVNRLKETQLPSQSFFFNKLTNESCSVDDYKHAENVWYTFNCNTILDYLLLYLKADVLLLCDIFESFRKVCKNIYNLDPCQYYTTPGLSWDAMLKTTEIDLELLTDINMYNFIVRGIRGGIVQCSKRHSEANNKYVSDYDSTKESNYLIYLDVNNLYGYAMSQYLPYKNFEWVENFENFNLNDVKYNSPIGYILEVDLEYPSTLHDNHNDLPFCAENKKNENMKQTKLITDLNDKTKYI
ncbi:uncharacterized protein LOC135963015 [Calliphora vicina]|uniref:uncharacterized protein LOC135963015 n=1 Tax=Calliphora vicina TaxID=7373 RepID=UPI00325AD5DD